VSDPDVLTRSWSAWSPSRALRYLRTEDAPSLGSRELLGDVLRGLGRGDDVSILDLGCGNAQFYEYLKSEGVRCAYTGVDVSDPLLDAAHEIHGDDARATFLKADLMTLDGVVGHWDVAVFSHVIEILSGPEDALQAAKRRADVIAIRFFGPPEF
jgi:SAM-dependent methyltransferase